MGPTSSSRRTACRYNLHTTDVAARLAATYGADRLRPYASEASEMHGWYRAERPRSPGRDQNGAAVSRRATSSREWRGEKGGAAGGGGAPAGEPSPPGRAAPPP